MINIIHFAKCFWSFYIDYCYLHKYVFMLCCTKWHNKRLISTCIFTKADKLTHSKQNFTIEILLFTETKYFKVFYIGKSNDYRFYKKKFKLNYANIKIAYNFESLEDRVCLVET